MMHHLSAELVINIYIIVKGPKYEKLHNNSLVLDQQILSLWSTAYKSDAQIHATFQIILPNVCNEQEYEFKSLLKKTSRPPPVNANPTIQMLHFRIKHLYKIKSQRQVHFCLK